MAQAETETGHLSVAEYGGIQNSLLMHGFAFCCALAWNIKNHGALKKKKKTKKKPVYQNKYVRATVHECAHDKHQEYLQTQYRTIN